MIKRRAKLQVKPVVIGKNAAMVSVTNNSSKEKENTTLQSLETSTRNDILSPVVIPIKSPDSTNPSQCFTFLQSPKKILAETSEKASPSRSKNDTDILDINTEIIKTADKPIFKIPISPYSKEMVEKKNEPLIINSLENKENNSESIIPAIIEVNVSKSIDKLIDNIESVLMKKSVKIKRVTRPSAWEIKEPTDHSKVIMRELIYFNPTNNPMKASKKVDSKEVLVLNENSLSQISNVNEEKKKKDSLKIDEDLPVPQLKIGPDGNIILNEASMIMEQISAINTDDFELVNETDLVQCGYPKRIRSKTWTLEETRKFYAALSMIGTDFFLMSRLFVARDRFDIKKKFKREEKRNQHLIDAALKQRRLLDITLLAEPQIKPVLEKKIKIEKSDIKKRKQNKKKPIEILLDKKSLNNNETKGEKIKDKKVNKSKDKIKNSSKKISKDISPNIEAEIHNKRSERVCENTEIKILKKLKKYDSVLNENSTLEKTIKREKSDVKKGKKKKVTPSVVSLLKEKTLDKNSDIKQVINIEIENISKNKPVENFTHIQGQIIICPDKQSEVSIKKSDKKKKIKKKKFRIELYSDDSSSEENDLILTKIIQKRKRNESQDHNSVQSLDLMENLPKFDSFLCNDLILKVNQNNSQSSEMPASNSMKSTIIDNLYGKLDLSECFNDIINSIMEDEIIKTDAFTNNINSSNNNYRDFTPLNPPVSPYDISLLSNIQIKSSLSLTNSNYTSTDLNQTETSQIPMQTHEQSITPTLSTITPEQMASLGIGNDTLLPNQKLMILATPVLDENGVPTNQQLLHVFIVSNDNNPDMNLMENQDNFNNSLQLNLVQSNENNSSHDDILDFNCIDSNKESETNVISNNVIKQISSEQIYSLYENHDYTNLQKELESDNNDKPDTISSSQESDCIRKNEILNSVHNNSKIKTTNTNENDEKNYTNIDYLIITKNS